MIGTINVPVKITATGTKIQWSIDDPTINLRIALDSKSASFTPSQNKTYKVTVIEDGITRIVEVVVGGTTPTPTPTPEPIPTPIPGLIYSSNIQGKWNNGVARFVTDKEGVVTANGFGFTVNASGGGGFRINGTGQGNLEPATAGHRRIYICACNYNALLKGEFCFIDSKPRNFSIKIRNRHQYGDMVDSNAPASKKQGGIGFSFSKEDNKAGFGIEVVHGTNTGDFDVSLPKALEVGKWYGFEVSVKDASASTIKVVSKLDYKDGAGPKTLFDKTVSAPSVFFNKADFDTWSQFWLRLNDAGKIGTKNIELYSI